METEAPCDTFTDAIVQSAGEVMSFSIFIASNTRKTSPFFTASPALTLILTIVPGIGAVTVFAPADGAEGAAAGAGGTGVGSFAAAAGEAGAGAGWIGAEEAALPTSSTSTS